MRVKNIKFSVFAIYSNGTMKHRFFVSETAKNNWCNAQYAKDEGTTCEVYDFETGNRIETWHT